MMNGLQSVTHWQTYFGSPTGALLGFFNAAYPLGGIIGSGSVVVAGVGAPYITEIAHPDQRSTATALFLTFYSIGSIIAGWCTFGTFRIDSTASWRIPSALQGLPSVIQLLFVWFVPESPRWLVSKDRKEEAFALLVKYHAEGNENDPLVVA